ncbi:unnamed protein product [Protopolystoma xenopodis]|uniref:Uncharacterized protein n=1 Tax=Protopolystoma xenopodis TaxID=117903 RepID=A0A448WQV5_9PLAT|nr:unnamed protein product [Protopolystoma xenopodis]
MRQLEQVGLPVNVYSTATATASINRRRPVGQLANHNASVRRLGQTVMTPDTGCMDGQTCGHSPNLLQVYFARLFTSDLRTTPSTSHIRHILEAMASAAIEAASKSNPLAN